jgi:hypothetical protein
MGIPKRNVEELVLILHTPRFVVTDCSDWAVLGVHCLTPFEYWDHGFEPNSRYGYICTVNSICWVVTLCSSKTVQSSEEQIAVIFRAAEEAKQETSKSRWQVSRACLWLLLFFYLGLLFHPEDDGDMFVRNAGLSLNYTALETRRPYSLEPRLENLNRRHSSGG